jgi:predicted transglutaminase-like protease
MTKKFAKSVSFNEKNETDKAILKHVARRNFSGYVKKLILEDMKVKEKKIAPEHKPLSNEKPNSEIRINSGNLKLKD